MKKKTISLLLLVTMLMSFMITMVKAETFTLNRNKILAAGDLPTYDVVDFGGKSEVMKFANTSTVGTKAIRYGGLGMGTDVSSANKTLLIDCYLEDDAKDTFSLNVVFRNVGDGNTWINSVSTSTCGSSLYSANKWVTVAINCKSAMKYLVDKSYTLNQLQIGIPNTVGNFYVGDVRFTNDSVPDIFTLERNKILTASDLPTYTQENFDGKSSVMKFVNTKSVGTSAIRYGNLNMDTSYGSSNRTLFVDCYLEDEEESTFSLGLVFRQTTGGKWINSEPASTLKSEKYPTNQWVTVAINCEDAMQYLISNAYSINQLQINIPSISGNFYVDDVKVVTVPENVTAIDLYDGDSKCEWKDGNLTVKIAFSEDFAQQDIKAYAVRYEMQEQKLVVADIQQIEKNVNANEIVQIPITVENADTSYMNVIVVDSSYKPICKAKTFGTVLSGNIASEAEGEGFYVGDPEIEGKLVKISGGEDSSSAARITVIIRKGTEVLFADQKKVGEDKKFAFEFNAKNSFNNGEKCVSAGLYTAYISSDCSENVLSKKVGIADEIIYSQVIDKVNNENKTDIVKILSKDPDFYLEYVSLSGKGLYLDEVSDNSIEDDIATRLISKKPSGGYTIDNFVELFNKIVTEFIFASGDADSKLAIIENTKYSSILGTASVVESKAYKALAGNVAKNTIFSGIPSVDFVNKIQENVIVLALNSAENAGQIRDIIEESATVIPVTLTSEYNAFTSAQLKSLYDDMLLKKTYQNYSDIASKFDASYNNVKNTPTNPTGNSSSSSSSGGGGSAFAVSITPVLERVVNNEGTSKFADIENLTWGKNEINALTRRGIISGISENKFSPDDSITREQFCRLIAEAYQIKGTADTPFGDIDDDAWYAESIKALYANNLISGISDASFGVGNRITRQDAAVILYNVIKNKLAAGYGGKEFDDEESIADYAKTAVSAMASAGIINGYDDNTFGSKKEITRREAAIVLYRALELGR